MTTSCYFIAVQLDLSTGVSKARLLCACLHSTTNVQEKQANSHDLNTEVHANTSEVSSN